MSSASKTQTTASFLWDRRTRIFHRWVSMIFTATVAANFAVMAFGTPPAWVTYAPLPPLFLLLATGLSMLVRHYRPRSLFRKRSADLQGPRRA